jgi:hypothetical protein
MEAGRIVYLWLRAALLARSVLPLRVIASPFVSQRDRSGVRTNRAVDAPDGAT